MMKSNISYIRLAVSALAISSATQMSAQTPQLGKAPLQQVINAMTLQEKLKVIIGPNGQMATLDAATIGNASSLVPGAAGQIGGVDRLGIPVLVMADGPAGLRISPTRAGTDKTFYCTHFPVGTLLSSTWNQTLVESVGHAMGDEVKHYGVDVLLAPGINIMRNPLCGRNFEYYSEDPLVAGKTAAAMVRGIQSNGVGTSVKHFALNNQETNRTGYNVVVDPRTAREIYLKPFEIAVKEAQPWTVMSSYNLVNGTMTSERADLLSEILRREWGFKGVVTTDWYGGRNAVQQVVAGNDLLMPGRYTQTRDITEAINRGLLNYEDLDRNLKRTLEMIQRSPRFNGYVPDNHPDLKAHAVVAREAATEGMVLLKNQKHALPISSKVKKMAVFGRTSYDFLAGGTGSGDVHHAYVVSLIEGLQNAGYSVDKDLRETYEQYIPEAKTRVPKDTSLYAQFLPIKMIPEMSLNGVDVNRLAAENDMAVITIGKSSGEFADRKIEGGFNLTPAEKEMISTVCKAFHAKGKKAVVILNVCGPIETASWIGAPDAVLAAWLPGQEGGNAVADILSGKVTPSGRLPMTWPRCYSDVPSANDFVRPDDISDAELMNSYNGIQGGNAKLGKKKNFDVITYNDSIYVGYRYYTTRNVPVSFPFGFGLSYTNFKYSKPSATVDASGNISLSVNVANSGKLKGKEVVQVYVSAPAKDMNKPARELKAYAKTHELAPGESETITLHIPYSDLASFNTAGSCWQVEPGTYRLLIARNAADTNPLQMNITEKGRVTETVKPCLLPSYQYNAR